MKIAGDICRYLGCGSAVSASGDARFGEGLGPVIGRPDCGHGKDGGIICSGGNPPRLVNGSSRCAGRVELHTKDTWGTLCGENLNMKIAEDICKYLGCGFALSASGSARFGEGLGPVIGRPDCGHGQDGGVFCSGGKPPRLVNGSSRCVGRVELYTNDTWGTVCGETLDMKIAEDICTYLECGFAVSASGGGRFGEGSGPVVGRPDCGHREAGGIFCSDHLQKPNISMMSDAQVIVRGESAEIHVLGIILAAISLCIAMARLSHHNQLRNITRQQFSSYPRSVQEISGVNILHI
ncbi:deleted in malignant brain tumors 1 protein-like [Callorhinchus milii]|uniref:deleted in malignant brain tumors 1 protein-like n=1 Tax=Callorhinchus milii TaxID=7868 RepID=UPI001C3F9866|nr:deleted in malignant brain tumors 1 protein-like [Callorhinchus milii]